MTAGPAAGPTTSTGRQALVAVYAVFAIAAGSRSAVQLATKGDEAPLAYTLSLVAALVYLVATLALRRTSARAHRIALTAVLIELVGVLVVGTLTVVDGELFPDQTVWSTYGIGYVFVPLLLPLAGLWWLLRHRPVV
jgi:uncharacterized membrane protein